MERMEMHRSASLACKVLQLLSPRCMHAIRHVASHDAVSLPACQTSHSDMFRDLPHIAATLHFLKEPQVTLLGVKHAGGDAVGCRRRL